MKAKTKKKLIILIAIILVLAITFVFLSRTYFMYKIYAHILSYLGFYYIEHSMVGIIANRINVETVEDFIYSYDRFNKLQKINADSAISKYIELNKNNEDLCYLRPLHYKYESNLMIKNEIDNKVNYIINDYDITLDNLNDIEFLFKFTNENQDKLLSDKLLKLVNNSNITLDNTITILDLYSYIEEDQRYILTDKLSELINNDNVENWYKIYYMLNKETQIEYMDTMYNYCTKNLNYDTKDINYNIDSQDDIIQKLVAISERESNIEILSSIMTLDDIFTPADKPVIYLYNYNEDVSVKVNFDNNSYFTCTYPKYNTGWNVRAYPDGHLEYNDKTYKYLYWEGKVDFIPNFDTGFCVKGSDTAEFLENSLSKLGLTDDEMNEFIVYWLPQMQYNNYNIISFDTTDYCNKAELEVNPTPDTIIRVFMTWYPSDTKINIKEQDLVTVERIGKTVVEWGGTQLN